MRSTLRMIWFGACLALGWKLYHTFDEVTLPWFEGQIETFRWNIAHHHFTLSDPTNALMFYGMIGIAALVAIISVWRFDTSVWDRERREREKAEAAKPKLEEAALAARKEPTLQ